MAKTVQGQRIALTHNLLLLYEARREREHGLRNAAEDRRTGPPRPAGRTPALLPPPSPQKGHLALRQVPPLAPPRPPRTTRGNPRRASPHPTLCLALAPSVGHRWRWGYHGLRYVGERVEQGGSHVLDLVERSSLVISLCTGRRRLVGPIVKHGDPDGPTNSPAYVWLPVLIPADAAALTFDYTVAGDPREDQLAFGLNGTNLFSIAGKFAPDGVVSAYAGTTNELFFGITGGSSTNCTVTVANIRFFTLQPPALAVDNSSGMPVLSWPSTANGYALESTIALRRTLYRHPCGVGAGPVLPAAATVSGTACRL